MVGNTAPAPASGRGGRRGAGPRPDGSPRPAPTLSGAGYAGANTTAGYQGWRQDHGGDAGQDVKLLKIGINIFWTLMTGFLVMFMQAGFALVETGLTRSKNVGHTMGMNFMVYAIGMLGFWICGFAIMFGGSVSVLAFDGPNILDKMVSFKHRGQAVRGPRLQGLLPHRRRRPTRRS